MNTNRRGFLGTLLKSAAGAILAPAILPSATTYVRRWAPAKPSSTILIPYWVQTKRDVLCYDEDYLKALQSILRAPNFTMPPLATDTINTPIYEPISYEEACRMMNGTYATGNRSVVPESQSESSLLLPGSMPFET